MQDLALTPAQRDALYADLADHLSGIGDLWLALEADDLGRAERLAGEFRDELTFLLNDVGFGERAVGEAVRLSTPAEVLCRVLTRLNARAEESDRAQADERLAVRREEAHSQLVRETCRDLLSRLGGCQ